MRRTALLLAGLGLFSACASEPTTPATASIADRAGIESSNALTPAQSADVAALRAATAGIHQFSDAVDAGWDTQTPEGCFSSPAGGMGFHFLKAGNVGTLDVTKPQFVMFEPEKNGQMKLVGVEFIVPGSPDDEPPVLFDRAFTYNGTFMVWALHVWAWDENPAGIFADWNPKVSCQYAGASAAMMH